MLKCYRLRDQELFWYQKCFQGDRSEEAKNKYEQLKTQAFKNEFDEFEEYVQDYWNLEVCRRFFMCVRTNATESFFATRLFWVPKNLNFLKSYKSRMRFCALSWNPRHISQRFAEVHGEEAVAYRKNWLKNIHNRVFRMHAPHVWIERRGTWRRDS